MDDLKSIIRDIPDFPKKGIIFKDITTLLADAKSFARALALLGEGDAGPRPHLQQHERRQPQRHEEAEPRVRPHAQADEQQRQRERGREHREAQAQPQAALDRADVRDVRGPRDQRQRLKIGDRHGPPPLIASDRTMWRARGRSRAKCAAPYLGLKR